jgi:hypothetical protein
MRRVVTSNKSSAVYDPELVGVLQEIFDLAWQQISSTSAYPGAGENADTRRNDLAQMIILAHRSGLQPEEIKAVLLSEITSVRLKSGASVNAFMSRAKSVLKGWEKT